MEGPFHYLNLTARPKAGPVRDLIEAWVQEYPADRRARIRGELRDDDKFHDAFFELFTHALLRKVGYEVEVEPTLINGLTPDFGIAGPDGMLGMSKSRCPRDGLTAKPVGKNSGTPFETR